MFARYEIVLGYLGLLLHKLCSEHSLRREKEKESYSARHSKKWSA